MATPPRHSRDFAGSFSLNNPDDGTPIKEMLSLGTYLYIITEQCTYRVQMADQIDPGRKNSALAPVFQQKLRVASANINASEGLVPQVVSYHRSRQGDRVDARGSRRAGGFA